MKLHTTTLFLLGLALAGSASAQSGADAAGERCEEAVIDTVRTMRGDDARQVQFVRARRSVMPTVGDETEVKGEGSYRGDTGPARPFTYSCRYDVKAGSTSGIVFRDTGAARAEAQAEKAWQPDLLNVSPEACESAIVAVLGEKYPRVGRIAFGSDTRQLKPAPNGRTGMEGQGSVERAKGMHRVPFVYRCEFEPRTGKVVSARTEP